MAYRIMLGSREVKKAVHLLLHLVALACAAVGLYAAFKFHHDLRAPDIRSLHAWLGITTAALYAFQVSQRTFKLIEAMNFMTQFSELILRVFFHIGLFSFQHLFLKY